MTEPEVILMNLILKGMLRNHAKTS